MYVCIIDYKGKVKVHENINTDPEVFFDLIFPFLDDLVVGVECVFCWYWLSDFCSEHKIPFILGHALWAHSHARAGCLGFIDNVELVYP